MGYSKWHGKAKNKKIRVALCMSGQIGNFVSIALSSISAYIKKYNSNIDVKIFYILDDKHEEKYLPEGFASYVQLWQPDLFAISVLSTHWFGVQPYLVELKQVIPDMAILIGGYQAILKSEETINFPPIDFLCDGDGEIPTSNLIKYLRGEIDGPVDGLWEKLNDGSIIKTPRYNLEDLPSIPLPDYSIYETNGELHFNHMSTPHRLGQRLLQVMTGRGCVYNCTYCSNSTLRQMWPGNKKGFIRKYDIEEFTDELVRLRDKYDINYFEFWDELFFSNVPYSLELFEVYKEKVKVPFSVVSRIEVMDYELCRLTAEAGCDAIYFGIESGSEDYRRKYLKRFDKNEQIITATEHCRKVGIKRISFNIIGMPFETKTDMLETLALNKKIDPEFFFFFIYIPLKGTKLYDITEEAGLLYPDSQNHDYLNGIYENNAKLNIKVANNCVSQAEFNEVRNLMAKFQQTREMSLIR